MAEPRPRPHQNHVDTVLQDYLDQLLIMATATPQPTDVGLTQSSDVAVNTTVHQDVVAPLRKTAVVQATALKTAIPLPELPALRIAVPEPAPAYTTDETIDIPVAPVAVSVPVLDWRASQGIECLIFKVAGLKLAIPLPLLGGVFPVSDKVTPLFGQAAWSLGVWQGDDAKLTIIDSAQLIMPERGIQLREAGYHFFIQLDRSPWALACQEICDTVTLVYDSIKWRGEGSKRPWLAGTVIAEMCALLDVPGIMQLLEQQRRPEGRNRG